LAAVTTRAPELASSPAPAAPRIRFSWRWALVALAIAVLYFVYWRLSWSAAANSDSAVIALQAQDVLHGNWLLHGWWVSDVSFYTTEVPQYALLELFGGFGAGVVHVAAAMSYTLIVVLVALVAMGRAGAGESSSVRWTRGLLAAGIVMAPQATGALILLLGSDHTGTVVPVLLTWLVIDRVRPGARGARWFMPVLVCALLTWIMVADSVVLFTGIGSLIIAAVVRASRRHARRAYELSLAGAAVVAVVLGMLIPKAITRLGGYQVWHFQTHTMPLSRLPHDAWNTVQAVLELFGANVFGGQASPGIETALTVVRFAGVLLAIAGLVLVLARFFREESILLPGLAVAIMLNLGAYLISIHSSNLGSIREIVAVMPFGAVLAGRLLAGPLLRVWSGAHRKWLAPVLAVVMLGYLGGLVFDATRPAIPSANQGIATWLENHGLTRGLAPYWQSSSITLDTSGRVTVNGIVPSRHGVGPYYWEVNAAQYNPSRHYANFVIADGPKSVVPIIGLAQAAERAFGPPAHTYHTQGYTILVWNKNLLPNLR
jgi:hypothetical protein